MLGKDTERSGSSCEEACWQVDIPVERRRAPFIARDTMCSHESQISLWAVQISDPHAPFKTHARPTLLKRMRYRFYSLTLHNFVRGSSLHISPAYICWKFNVTRVSTSYERIIYSR